MAKFLNHYHCPNCGAEWDMEWSSTCNDKCPNCSIEVEPHKVDDVLDNPSSASIEPVVMGIGSVLALCIPKGLEVSYMESGEYLRKWCADNNATYYARPRESFSIQEAKELAIAEGKSIVVAEDMS